MSTPIGQATEQLRPIRSKFYQVGLEFLRVIMDTLPVVQTLLRLWFYILFQKYSFNVLVMLTLEFALVLNDAATHLGDLMSTLYAIFSRMVLVLLASPVRCALRYAESRLSAEDRQRWKELKDSVAADRQLSAEQLRSSTPQEADDKDDNEGLN